MKAISSILIFAVASAALPSVTGPRLCVDSVLEGADPSNYNLCREHPSGHNVADLESGAQARSFEELSKECGDLGVMEVPAGADPSKYRKCRDHPLGKQVTPDQISAEGVAARDSNTTSASPLYQSVKRDGCWYGKSFGCAKDNYCYATCGQPGAGQWCWLANNYGAGSWTTCATDAQCDPSSSSLHLGCGGKCSC